MSTVNSKNVDICINANIFFSLLLNKENITEKIFLKHCIIRFTALINKRDIKMIVQNKE